MGSAYPGVFMAFLLVLSESCQFQQSRAQRSPISDQDRVARKLEVKLNLLANQNIGHNTSQPTITEA